MDTEDEEKKEKKCEVAHEDNGKREKRSDTSWANTRIKLHSQVHFGSKKKFDQKSVGSKKISSKIYFCPKKFGPKNLGSKILLVQ